MAPAFVMAARAASTFGAAAFPPSNSRNVLPPTAMCTTRRPNVSCGGVGLKVSLISLRHRGHVSKRDLMACHSSIHNVQPRTQDRSASRKGLHGQPSDCLELR